MQELASVVAEAKRGDAEAFEDIVLRFQNMAYAVAYAMLYDPQRAQDAAQEAFIDAYVNLPRLREPAAFPGWFRRIVVKHSDRQMRGKHTLDLPIEAAESMSSSVPDPASILERVETKTELHAAIANLPEKQRLVTTLFYIKGYSLKEIAEILEMPQNNIKKYLFIARQKLKRRMIVMISDQLQDTKPSKDDHFANKVAYFIALRAGDTQRLGALLDQSPELIEAKTEWGIASQGYYWPTGITGLHWAAGSGDEVLMKLLLARGADVNSASSSGITPLHFAALMRQEAMVRALLKAGAHPDPTTEHGHTPLHFAAMRGYVEIATYLKTNGASTEAADQQSRTPLDWARLKGYSDLVHVLDGEEKGKLSETGEGMPPKFSTPQVAGVKIIGKISKILEGQKSNLLDLTMLETGIKIIDLLAPIQRGGRVGVFTPLPGVGKLVLLGQIIHSLAHYHGGYALYLGMEYGSYTAQNLRLAWREWGIEEQVILAFGEMESGEDGWERVIEGGLRIARELLGMGREVLLIVDVPPEYPQNLVEKIRVEAADPSRAAITVVFTGGFSAGALPDEFEGLDGVITFNVERARRSLWPAVDPLRSWSAYLEAGNADQVHVETARQVRKSLWRAMDLRYMVEKDGIQSLEHESERLSWLRAERIERFMTQRFTGAEPWTGAPGDYVRPEDTLAGLRSILDGECDQLPEEALYFIGRIEEAFSKDK